MADENEILEPIRAPAIFATGIGAVNVKRGLVHFILTADQCRLIGPGVDRIAVARVTVAEDRLREIIKRLRLEIE